MKTRYSILLLIVVSVGAHAQLVDIPDVNLRAAILEELGRPHDSPLSVKDMGLLQRLRADARGIVQLSGLEFASRLDELSLGSNAIVDLSPLARLTNLTSLRLNDNRIVDVTPLANLTKLRYLVIDWNRIVDVRPLAQLAQLESLEIHHNRIIDHSPLDELSLSHFTYDQTCDMPPRSVTSRIANRDYPSIFARWSGFGWPPVSNRPELSDAENLALHDLRFSGSVFGLNFREVEQGFAMVGMVKWAVEKRDSVLALNPNAIHLVDVGMRAAPLSWYPEDSPYWLRDDDGNVYLESPEVRHGLLDFTKPIVQDLIVGHAIAVARCGLYDGIFFDYWSESWRVLNGFRTLDEELEAREIILRRIRAQTRPDFLVMGNVNAQPLPRTAPYVNGGFMETVLPFTQSAEEQQFSLTAIQNSLRWLDTHLREPRINGLEGWTIPDEPPDSPDNLRWMRAFTTMSLTHSNGYVVFTESLKWGHDWYDFWDADLGRPVGAKLQRHQGIEGLYIREFTNGWAVYNNSGEARVIELPEEVRAVASNLVNTEHALPPVDGEIYLKVTVANPADVNGDGVVNILDLVVVANAMGSGDAAGDVNGDGVVNVFDLVLVAEGI